MITQANPGEAVWMVIDDEVVPGRLVEIFADPTGAGPSGLRALVSYSDQARCSCPRSSFAEYVFPEAEWASARALADCFREPGDPLELYAAKRAAGKVVAA